MTARGVFWIAPVFIVAALVVLGAILVGPPYTHLDCREDGYSFGHSVNSEPLKNPAGMCEEKQSSIHPVVYDIRVHIEQKFGYEDYTGYQSNGEITVVYQNGTQVELDCADGKEFLRENWGWWGNNTESNISYTLVGGCNV